MSGWEQARRILAVRLDTLGDVLMTTPALHALRAAGPPDRTITLLTSRPGAAAARLSPDVDDVLVYDAPWMKSPRPSSAPTPDLVMIERLRSRLFDAAAIFTVFSQNPLPAALLCHLSGIPLRLAHCRENPYRLLTDWVPETEPEKQVRHEARRQLDLVAAVGASPAEGPLRMTLGPEACERAGRLLEEAGVRTDRPFIVVHPGATASSRRYPARSFAAVLRRLVADDGLQVVVTGGEDEQELAADLAAQAGDGAHALAGKTGFEELAAVIARARLLLSNNTGPVHVAAALGVPVVDLYALTNPQHTPWLVPSRVLSHDVPCRWCYKSVCPEGHHLCLRGIEPDEVVTAVRELLRETAAVPGVI